jgi:hypothetical protein
VFNRSYEKEKIKKNKKSFLNKAKSIFDWWIKIEFKNYTEKK